MAYFLFLVAKCYLRHKNIKLKFDIFLQINIIYLHICKKYRMENEMKVRKLVYVMLFFLLILSISTGLKVFADSDESENSEEMLDEENLNDGNIGNDLKSFPPVIEGEDGNGNSPLGLPPVIDDDGNGNSPLNNPINDGQ